MNVFELVGKIGIEGSDKVKSELTGVSGALEKHKAAIMAVGAAFTAVGAAGLKFAADSRQVNAGLTSTGITLGKTTKEMRDLTLATTNVTFPIKSVVATFDLLTRAGMRNTDEIKKTATAFDTLGDATGSSAEQVADILLPALKSFGEQLPENANDLDKFTWLTKNTTVELSEFGSVMSYVAAYGKDLDLTSEDLIATLAALEARGISGSAATKVFRTAITEASKEGKSLNEVLGLSQTEIDGFKSKIDGATGSTQEYADAMNTQYGIMAKLKQRFSELTLQLGSFLEPLEPVLAGMTALGPMMIGLIYSLPIVAKGFHSLAAGITAVKAAGIAGVATSLGTIATAFTAIAAAAAGVYLAVSTLTGIWGGAERNLSLLEKSLVTTAESLARFEKEGKGSTQQAQDMRDRIADLIEKVAKQKEKMAEAIPVVKAYAETFSTVAERVKAVRAAAKQTADIAADAAIRYRELLAEARDAIEAWSIEGAQLVNKILRDNEDAAKKSAIATSNAIANAAIAVGKLMADAAAEAAAIYKTYLQEARDTASAWARAGADLLDKIIQDNKDALQGLRKSWWDWLATFGESAKAWKAFEGNAEKALNALVEMTGKSELELVELWSGAGFGMNDFSVHWKEMVELAGGDWKLLTENMKSQMKDALSAMPTYMDYMYDKAGNVLGLLKDWVGNLKLIEIPGLAGMYRYTRDMLTSAGAGGGVATPQLPPNIVPDGRGGYSVIIGGAAYPVAPGDIPNIFAGNAPPEFQHGGIVPGGIGQSMLATVHGGETITPAGKGGLVTITGNTFNVRQESDIDRIAELLVSKIRLRTGVRI